MMEAVMIEFKTYLSAYRTLAAAQSMTDAASEDVMRATESQSPAPNGTNP